MKPSKALKQKITPFLWFDNQAEEAARYYTSIFKHSKILSTSYYEEGSPGPTGTVMAIIFELKGQTFYALNGGPLFKFTPAISFFVTCSTQLEIDNLWEKLSTGGIQRDCGWLQDKYGVSWQIVPTILNTMLEDKDPARSKRIMGAMLKMRKLDIKKLQQAYDGNE